MIYDIGVIGRAVWDSWNISDSKLSLSKTDCYGGSGANTAVALANFGLKTSFATRFGTDKVGIQYYSYLKRFMDLSYAIRTSEPMPVANITPTKSFHYANDHDGFFDQNRLKVNEFLAKCSSVFFVEPNIDLTTFSLPKIKFLSPQLSLVKDKELLLKNIGLPWDAIFLNHKEKFQFEKIVDQNLLDYSKANKIANWIITYGSEPSQLIVNGKTKYFTVPPANGYNMPVGCGDMFAASFCTARLKEIGIEKSINFGHITSKVVLKQVGCQLTKEQQSELLKFLH